MTKDRAMTERSTEAGTPSLVASAPLRSTRRDEFVALLTSVSHDLRSPLLTVALSGDLLRDAVDGGDADGARASPARRCVRAFATSSACSTRSPRSRAPRNGRWHRAAHSPACFLEGHWLSGDGAIDADASLAADLVDALGGGTAVEVRTLDAAVEVAVALADEAGSVPDGSPLAALLDSLKAYAGTVVERLAAIELQASRQGGALRIDGGRALLTLPRG